MSFSAYREWLLSRWGLAIDDSKAVEFESYDPARTNGPVAERLDMKEARDIANGLSSDQITYFMARVLERQRLAKRDVWEVGCGTGLLSVLAARQGARHVRATDVDAKMTDLARRTAELNGVSLDTAVTHLFEGTPWETPVDVLIADLPQKPNRNAGLPTGQNGGPEGTSTLIPFLDASVKWLRSGGTLYFFMHTLPHPEGIRRLHELYSVRLLGHMKRIFQPDAFSGIVPFLRERRERNQCWFEDLPDGRHAFLGMVFEATRS